MWPFDCFTKKKPEPTVEELAVKEIEDKNAKIKLFEAKIADVEAMCKKLTAEVNETAHEIDKWTLIKIAAVKTGVESNIREAVRQHMEAQQKYDDMVGNLSSVNKLIIGLKEQLRFAHTKVDCSEARAINLTARLETAKIRQDLADEPVKLTDLEDKTIEAESKAEANEEISDYQQDFLKKNVVSNSDVEFEVKRLMKEREAKKEQ
jgi:phage shock protein A